MLIYIAQVSEKLEMYCSGAVIPVQEASFHKILSNFRADTVNISPLLGLVRTKRDSDGKDFYYKGNGIEVELKHDDANNKLNGGELIITIDDLPNMLSNVELNNLYLIAKRNNVGQVKLKILYQIPKDSIIKLDIEADFAIVVDEETEAQHLIHMFSISCIKKGSKWATEVSYKPQGSNIRPFEFSMESCSKCFEGKIASESILLLNANFEGTIAAGEKFKMTLIHQYGLDFTLQCDLDKSGNSFSISFTSKALHAYNFVIEANLKNSGSKSELQVMLTTNSHPRSELFHLAIEYHDMKKKWQGGKLTFTYGDFKTVLPSLYELIYGYGRRTEIEISYIIPDDGLFEFNIVHSTDKYHTSPTYYEGYRFNPEFYKNITNDFLIQSTYYTLSCLKKGSMWATEFSVKKNNLDPTSSMKHSYTLYELTMESCSKCIKGKMIFIDEDLADFTFEGKFTSGISFKALWNHTDTFINLSLEKNFKKGKLTLTDSGTKEIFVAELDSKIDEVTKQETVILEYYSVLSVHRVHQGSLTILIKPEVDNMTEVDITSTDLLKPELVTLRIGERSIMTILTDSDEVTTNIGAEWKEDGLMKNNVTAYVDGEFEIQWIWDFINLESIGYMMKITGMNDGVTSFKYVENLKLAYADDYIEANIAYDLDTFPKSSSDFEANALIEVNRRSGDYKVSGKVDIDADDEALELSILNGKLEYNYM